MSSKYSELNSLSWESLQVSMPTNEKLPLSVHCPLNWPGSLRQIMCDCAFNAWIMDTPHLDMGDNDCQAVRDRQHWEMLSWFFDRYPAIADCQLVKTRRKHGGLPIIEMEFVRWNFIYRGEYCVDPAGDLRIRMTVINDADQPQTGHLWLRPAYPKELGEASEYHYWPFIWNNRRIKPDWSYNIDTNSNCILFKGKKQGTFSAPGFDVEWKSDIDYSDIDFNYCRLSCSCPQYARPEFQIKQMNNLLHFSTDLLPQESRSIEIVYQSGSLAHSSANGTWSNFDAAEQAAIERWRSVVQSGIGTMQSGNCKDDAALEATQLCSLQLLLRDDAGYRPCQGGTTERFFVWVWEAMCSLRPLLRFGYFEQVKQALDFIFSMQDRFSPTGKFTSVDGAIGTTGPRWANATGSALLLAADFLKYNDYDSSLLDQYLEKMLRAGHWVVNEVRATRIPGNPTYGVFPECGVSDGCYGQSVFTDTWTLGGLMKFCAMLKDIKHPDHTYFQEECNAYRKDYLALLDKLVNQDGRIRGMYGATTPKEKHHYASAYLDYSLAAVDKATSPRMIKHLDWLEENAFVEFFCCIVTYDVYYIGNNELAAMHMWLARHEWKKAWMAAKAFRRYVLTPDLFLTQERYAANEPAFTAWQPNASNNGRFADLQFYRLFLELEDEIILFGGFSPLELKNCPGFQNMYTKFGVTSMQISSGGTITVNTQKTIPAGTRFTTPWRSIVVRDDTCQMTI